MCFSAGASFGAAAILCVAGTVTIKKAKNPSQLMFAAIPLLFGMQQLTEGFVWLSFNNPAFESYHSPMMYAFLFFAQIFWPSWVPISIWNMETDKKRKKSLAYLGLLGLAGSALLAYRLIYLPVSSNIEGHHIQYQIVSHQWIIISSSILYVLSTLGSPLVSSLKYMKGLSLIMLTALVVTQIFYAHYLISVWCFFSALLSTRIYFILQNSRDWSHLHSLLHKRINPDKMEW